MKRNRIALRCSMKTYRWLFCFTCCKLVNEELWIVDWSETELICVEESSETLDTGATSALVADEGVKTLVSANEPDHSSLSQSSGDGKASPHPSNHQQIDVCEQIGQIPFGTLVMIYNKIDLITHLCVLLAGVSSDVPTLVTLLGMSWGTRWTRSSTASIRSSAAPPSPATSHKSSTRTNPTTNHFTVFSYYVWLTTSSSIFKINNNKSITFFLNNFSKPITHSMNTSTYMVCLKSGLWMVVGVHEEQSEWLCRDLRSVLWFHFCLQVNSSLRHPARYRPHMAPRFQYYCSSFSSFR